MFQEDVRCAVEEDNERLDEFRRRHCSLSRADNSDRRPNVPCPAHLAEAAHPPSQGEETIPKEYSALDGMREAIEHIVAALNGTSTVMAPRVRILITTYEHAPVDHCTGHDSREPK